MLPASRSSHAGVPGSASPAGPRQGSAVWAAEEAGTATTANATARARRPLIAGSYPPSFYYEPVASELELQREQFHRELMRKQMRIAELEMLVDLIETQ